MRVCVCVAACVRALVPSARVCVSAPSALVGRWAHRFRALFNGGAARASCHRHGPSFGRVWAVPVEARRCYWRNVRRCVFCLMERAVCRSGDRLLVESHALSGQSVRGPSIARIAIRQCSVYTSQVARMSVASRPATVFRAVDSSAALRRPKWCVGVGWGRFPSRPPRDVHNATSDTPRSCNHWWQ